MTNQKWLAKRDDRSFGVSAGEGKPFGMSAWSIIGGIALATVAVAVITSLPDIKRYIKISTM